VHEGPRHWVEAPG
jgi:hypothetical protein